MCEQSEEEPADERTRKCKGERRLIERERIGTECGSARHDEK